MRHVLIALFWAALLITLYMTLRPVTVVVPGSDKTQHAITFGTLMLLYGVAYVGRPLIIGAMTLGFLGGLIEIVQPCFGRSQDVRDWIADLVGILVVSATLWIFRASRRGRGQAG